MDAERLTELYRTYAPLVHARARRLVGPEADDVVQEVFLKLVRTEPTADVLPKWLYAAATNACLDRLRKSTRQGDAWQGQVRGAEQQRRTVNL
jgi:RNA polymerase sigma factor (sigma-70 family)